MSFGGSSCGGPAESILDERQSFEFPYIDDVEKYENLVKIGQGTFGEVIKAKCRKTGKLVAIKKIFLENEKEGFPITALREIMFLKRLNHENIAKLIEICNNKNSTQTSSALSSSVKPQPYNGALQNQCFLVFSFYDHDLAGIISNRRIVFSFGEIKTIVNQILNALFYIHSQNILHRDIKSANIFLSKSSGKIKIGDFGLARSYTAPKRHGAEYQNRYTNRVVTLWYRAPELLLGDRNYSTAIDIWGVGCVMAELWTRSPIMQGRNEQNQLMLITNLCGSIVPAVWPKIVDLPLYTKLNLPKHKKRNVRERLKPLVKDQYAIDLLDQLLLLDPSMRIDADTALNHDLFFVDPMPCTLDSLLSQCRTSMFEYLSNNQTSNAPNHSDVNKGAVYDHIF
ncbi:MAG: P-TEFb-associated cyclin-dependent protein kinase Cdk9 [Marteilia pararefringens]